MVSNSSGGRESEASGPFLSGTMRCDPSKARLPKLLVYVDEHGDRNCEPNRQSDHFAMTAVLVPEEDVNALRIAVGGLKSLWKIKRELHWVDHARASKAGRRDEIARTLGQLPVRTVNIVLDKTLIYADSYLRQNQSSQYNYMTRYLLERVAHAAAGWQEGGRVAQVMFGLVGGVDPDQTLRYLNHVATHSSGQRFPVPWENILWQPSFRPTHADLGLQAADSYCGMLAAAVKDDDPTWLLATKHQLWRHHGQVFKWGIKTAPNDTLLIRRSWWAELMTAR